MNYSESFGRQRHFSEGSENLKVLCQQRGGGGGGVFKWYAGPKTKILDPYPGGVFPHIMLLFMAL